jgi:hypothetical protein
VRILSYCFVAVALAFAANSAQAQSTQATASMPSAITPTISLGQGTAPTTYGWAGTWFSDHYAGGYVGAVTALNSNLWTNGFLLRGDVSAGRYNYVSSGSDVDVTMHGADMMLGYRAIVGTSSFTIYGGPSYEAQPNGDPAAAIHGTKVGAKVFGDFSNKLTQDLELDLQGSFATPFSTYSATARLLYQVADRIWVGPQATLYGNRAPYQEGTVGAYVKYVARNYEMGASGGYRHPMKTTSGSLSDADGYFASIYIGVPFH